MADDAGRTRKVQVSASATLLRELRERAGYSIRQIAKLADFESASAYQHYEARYKKAALPVDIVEKLRPALRNRHISDMDIDRLILRVPNIEEVDRPIVFAPIISWVQAGELTEVPNAEILTDYEASMPVSYERDTIFFLRVRGNSMNLIAPDGALILVDYSDKEPLPKKCYVIKSDGHASFKQYQASPPCFVPASSESGHAIIPISEKIEIIGRVVKVQTDL